MLGTTSDCALSARRNRRWPATAPMVRLTVVPAIPLALSDAMKTAMLASSSSAMTRRVCAVLAKNPVNCSQVRPDVLA
jgi:hypothetical protein